MKKIVTVGLVSSIVVLNLLFATNSENNSSKESNSTIESKEIKEVEKSLTINLDKYKKKDTSKSGEFYPVKGVLEYSHQNNKIKFRPSSGGNDEVAYVENDAKICLMGTKISLLKRNFKVTLTNNGKLVPGYSEPYKKRNICIKISDIKSADLLLIEDGYQRLAVEITIEKMH